MNPGRKSDFVRLPSVCLYLLAWMFVAPVFTSRLSAQEYVSLVSFTNTWRYNQAGQNLGTSWVASDYNDTAAPWQSGPALLGAETIPLPGNYNIATLVPHVIPTPLSLFSSGGTNGTNITFYFRTTFTNSLTNRAGVELWATNLVDDGCVIYLNGTRAGHVRLTSTNQNYLTLAFSGPFPEGSFAEGRFDNVRLPVSLLVQGTNFLAVEVHQSLINSTDVAYAMRLVAVISTPLVITSQPPDSVSLYAEGNWTLSVGVAGGPAFYRWQRDGLNVSGGTNATLVVPQAFLSAAGAYRCIITNSIGAITSSTTVVSLVTDRTGPRPLEAKVLPAGLGYLVNVPFDEPVLSTASSPNRNLDNYRIVTSGTTNQFVTFTNVQLSRSNVVLRGITNLVNGGSYYLILNNVIDNWTNSIAPNTIVPVSWPHRFDLLAPDAVWKFHAAAATDYFVYDQDWTAPEYVPGPSWAEGPGIFYGGTTTASPCMGPVRTILRFQSAPTLFRTTFQWPATNGPNAQLTLGWAADDGGVVFLNGREIFRQNIIGPIDYYARGIGIESFYCATNSFDVTNLLPGTNWLAAAVFQAIDDTEVTFGLSMSAVIDVPSPVPDNPTPALQFSRLETNDVCLSWAGYGYALESSTSLSLGSESYPSGPWIPVANMSNPYTNILSDPSRFFRLRK